MKFVYILLLCLCCGCATNDMQTINLLTQRVNTLEKQAKGVDAKEIQRNTYLNNKLNDAQKDFVGFMLNYLGEKE